MPPSPSAFDLIILGASARAAADSARRASIRSWCCDLFADSDLCAVAVMADRCEPGQYPQGLVRWLDRAKLPRDAPALLTGALENHPHLVAAVAQRRRLWTPGPDAVRLVRDPLIFSRLALPDSVIPCATASDEVSIARWMAGKGAPASFLNKPRGGSAGRGIRHGEGATTIRGQRYCQEYVEGMPVGAVYCAGPAGVQCHGVTGQLIGPDMMATTRFQYGGNIGPFPLSSRQRDGFDSLGQALTRQCGLHGLFGVDAIIDRRGDIRPLEVNPRYTAGIEVLERAGGRPVFDSLRPCDAARRDDVKQGSGVAGKSVIYARCDAAVPDLAAILGTEQVADIPREGTAVRRGEPVCTVLASAGCHEDCEALLRERATRVHDALTASAQ